MSGGRWPSWLADEQRADLDAAGAPSIMELARRCGVPAPTILHRLKAGHAVALATDPATRFPPIAKHKRQKRPRPAPPDDGLTARQRGARQREAVRIEGGNNLAALHPDVALEWVPELNDGLTAGQVSPRTNKRLAWWRCARCAEPYQAPISNRTKRIRPSGCPKCAAVDRMLTKEEWLEEHRAAGANLRARFASIAAELLSDDGPPAELVSPASQNKRRWRCPDCGNVYRASPAGRTTRDNGCPECWIKRRAALITERVAAQVRSGRTLARAHPVLCPEWSSENALGPDQVTPRSNQKVWWIGSCGHRWNARVAARTDPKDPRGCPVCAGRAVSDDRNFKVLHPEFLDEWSFAKNAKGPEEYTPASNQRVWWLCSNKECGKDWRMAIVVRLAGSGCPACTIAKRSMVEIRITFELAMFFPSIHPTEIARIQLEGGAVEPDALLSETEKVVFEYDGCRFHDESKDIDRTRRLTAAGWRVIALRELPLQPLTPESFTWNGQKAFAKPHRVAQEVLRRARDLCGLVLPPEADAYLAADAPLARVAADVFIKSRRVPAWRRRRRGRAPPVPPGSHLPVCAPVESAAVHDVQCAESILLPSDHP